MSLWILDPLVLAALVTCFSTQAICASINTPAVLTISPGACSGIEIDGLSPKFSYALHFDAISEPACADKIRLSKFYVQEACVKTRNNQISVNSVKDLTCTKTNANDHSCCKFVFSEGPEDAKITINSLAEGQTYDKGPVCANENSGYVFVQSNCTQMADVSVTFQQSTYKGPVCLDLNGHRLTGWAIAVVSVASSLVFIISIWMIWSFCCGSYCC